MALIWNRRRFAWRALVEGLRHWVWVFGLISLMSGATVFGLVAFALQHLGLGIVLGICTVAAASLFEGSFVLQREEYGRAERQAERVRDLEAAPKPNLGIVGVSLDREARLHSFVRTPNGLALEKLGTKPMSWVRVLVANDPVGIGATATKVIGNVEFVNALGERVTMSGRWSDQKQAPELARLGHDREGREIDISANGDPRALDIAMKYDDESVAYAYNNTNGTVDGGRLDRHLLKNGPLAVTVTVKGENTERIVRHFQLTLDTPDGALLLEEAD